MAIVIKKKAAAPAPIADGPAQVPELADAKARASMANHPGCVVAWFMAAAYCWHVHKLRLVSDGFYDEMARRIVDGWQDLHHQHKTKILPFGRGWPNMARLAKTDYPELARCSARELAAAAGAEAQREGW